MWVRHLVYGFIVVFHLETIVSCCVSSPFDSCCGEPPARNNQNAIWGLEDEGGNLIEDDKGIKALGVRYFNQIFKDDHQTNIESQLKVIRLFHSFIQQEETKTFTSQISLEEVEMALKYFKKDKSLGPDGWPVEFFFVLF